MTNKDGRGNTHTGASADDLNGVISRVYDVALDPLRYEEMLDSWEQAIASFRQDFQDLSLLANGLFADHVSRANSMLDTLSRSDTLDETDALLSSLTGTAAFVIGPDLTLVSANSASISSLGAVPGGPLSQLTIEPADATVMAERCRAIFHGQSASTTMLRIRTSETDRIVVVQFRLVTKADGVPVIVAACSEPNLDSRLPDTMRKVFGLTRAEAEIVMSLMRGRNPREVAEARGRSPETIRGQIKTILGKTETRSQVELIRLIMSLLTLAAQDACPTETKDDPMASSGGISRLERLIFQTVPLPDRRRMDYLVMGDPGGRPVIFLPNGFGYQRLTASAELDARQRGLRLIAPILPGYGRSSGLPIKAHYGQGAARDIARLLDHLKLSQITAITISGAHNYLSELEKIRPNSTRLIIATAGFLPFDRSQQFERMGKWHRFVQSTSRFSPRLLPFVVRAGFRLAARTGPANFMTSVFKSSPADLSVIADSEALEAFVASSIGTNSYWHSAHVAYAQQAMNIEREDQADLLKWMSARVPVHFVNGDQDVGMRLETLKELRPSYPNITFHTLRNAGQLIIYSHWRYVFDLLHSLEKEPLQSGN